ncbi:uncharacterized protein LOC131662466 [Vicia villosa]|uniref:uncharacterized protein LOC131662466 n=1 Tax=Vicia villosa TaxID=3911 RepID=UPI00273C0352|nr:uncharacterized protein LOC131662466 [Vicia villosa]
MEVKLSEVEWCQARYDQLNLIEEKRMTALCHSQLYHERMKRAFDKKVRPRRFKEGDLVLKKILPLQPDPRGKLTPNYEGPYVVKRAFSGGALTLTTMDACLSIDVEGRSSGLAVLWRHSGSCSVSNYTRNFINLVIKDENRGDWRLSCYYGFPERSRRKLAWDMIRDIRNMSHLPWCIIGDFNDLLSQEDKRGTHTHPNWLCTGFRQAVTDCDLIDIALEGYQYTWVRSRGSAHMVEERLDRAMATTEWLDLFLQVSLKNLMAAHSDHNPILLSCDILQSYAYRRKFRFENSWLQEQDIDDVVHEGWLNGGNINVEGRLVNCANSLEVWSRNRRRSLRSDLDRCRATMELYRGENDEFAGERFIEAQAEYNKALLKEDLYWRQRAKMHWLRNGDMNTKFFHQSATARKNFKRTQMLHNIDGSEIKEQASLCDIAKFYFEELFRAGFGDYDPVLSLIQQKITEADNTQFLQPLSMMEVKNALFDMHPDKSPGPDGFNPDFFQEYWEVCGEDIYQAALVWLERGFFPSSLNDTNICLIPKITNLSTMKEFRPISLCNVIYKIVSKALANRLQKVLDKCVSEEQSAFVEGRSILHNAMIASEIIHHLKRKTSGRNASLALKIDISKAYDKVDWGFLKGMLMRLGFADKWIHWIMMCVTSVNYSVLVNTDSVGPIEPGRGLRQGDPLANLSEVHHIMNILDLYAKAAGQEINLTKSEVFFSRNLSIPAQEDLAKVMGVRHVLGTGNYLGLPSLIGRSKKATFSFIKDRIWKRINSWRGRSLSRAGKETMIKSVLQAIPAYIMSIFLIPDGVINDIERMINSFWWGGGSNGKGIRWMAWDKLTCPKAEGGLGFRDFKAFNMAMVAKQGWFLMSNPAALVSKIFKARYFPRSSFFDANLGFNPSFVWRSVWKAREVLSLGCRWSIGDGNNIKVMNEPWLRGAREGCLNGPQRHAAYTFSVRDLLLPNVKQWNMRVLREVFDPLVIKDILQVPLLEDVTMDRLVWKEEHHGVYSVRSGYRIGMKARNSNNRGTDSGIWNNLWGIVAPARVKHLLWRICRDFLPTRVRLRLHRVPCVPNCPTCDSAYEDDWHVLFGCHDVISSWRAAGLFNVISPRLHSFQDAKSIIFDVCCKEDRNTAGRVAVMIEGLWKNRNDWLWNKEKEDASKLGWLAYHKWQDWFSAQQTLGTTNRGWCLRDDHGEFVVAGTAWDGGTFFVLEAEALALKEAIREVLVHGLKSNSCGNSEFNVIINSIKLLLLAFPNFEVKFVKRQANLVAHSLAKAANSWTRRMLFDVIPLCISSYLINES